MRDKESKKLPKPPQRHISLGIIPSNIAVGPLGFRVEPAATAKSEQNRSRRDFEADDPDSTVALGKKDTRVLRIVSQENKGEDHGLAITEVSTPDAVVGCTEQGNDLTSERFCLRFGSIRVRADTVVVTTFHYRLPDEGGGWAILVLEVADILLDLEQEAVEAFGPLKAALGAVSTIYEICRVC